MADGKVVIEADLDSSKVQSGLSKLKSIAGGAAKGIGVGVGAIGTALVGAVGKSVQMAGELEQQIGGTEAVFGDLANTVQNKAVKAYETVGCSGVSRVDFLIVDDVPYILEINTSPGMTETSDLPAQSEVMGIDYDNLVLLILKSAGLNK